MNPLTHHHLLPPDEPTPGVVPRVRLSWLLAGFGFFWLLVIGRSIQLELADGDAFRAEAIKPLRREIVLPSHRGRILARDGRVLAGDEQLFALAMHYRYLQREPEAAWLRGQARRRLRRADCRNRERVDAECDRLREEIASLNVRLAALCGQSPAEWRTNCRRIETHIETMAAKVNTRRWEKYSDRIEAESPVAPAKLLPWWNIAGNLPDALRALGTPEPAMWEPVVLKEQVDYHILVENVAPAAVEAVRRSPDQFPGVRIVEVPRRTYPAGTLAANVLGHLQNAEQPHRVGTPSTVGAMGLEKTSHAELAGTDGRATERTDRHGQLLATDVEVAPIHGTDLPTTLNAEYQATAEALLDHVLARLHHASGGAVVLLHVQTGEVLTLATAPRFDPNAFALGEGRAITSALTDPCQPMFDRAARMALPPGGMIRPFAAVAMMASQRVPAHVAFQCSGQLTERGDIQCTVFQEQGTGHGGITLLEAIGCDCRVYFAHYAAAVGAQRFVQTFERFGFGTPTGLQSLPEASGTLPDVVAQVSAKEADGAVQLLAIGQGNITVTPLQMACAMGVFATEGRLQTPRLLAATPMCVVRTGISPAALKSVRQALERSVADAKSAAHGTLASDTVAVAGIAGTARVAKGQLPHAWCAGYFPARAPKYAFAVAIEHGGEGLRTAAPLARKLIERVAEREEVAASAPGRRPGAKWEHSTVSGIP